VRDVVCTRVDEAAWPLSTEGTISMRSQFSRWALTGTAAVASLVLAVPTSSAAPTHDTAARHHGYTRVAIAPPVYKLLTSSGIQVAPRGAATAAPFRNTVAATFPITKIRHHQKVFLHKGGLRFSAGNVSINVGRFTVSTITNRVTGRVSGSEVGDAGRVALFRIKATNRPRLGDVKLNLTKVAAHAINATFGVHAFSKGDTFGYATVNPR
jgi:hypothetical protein